MIRLGQFSVPPRGIIHIRYRSRRTGGGRTKGGEDTWEYADLGGAYRQFPCRSARARCVLFPSRAKLIIHPRLYCPVIPDDLDFSGVSMEPPSLSRRGRPRRYLFLKRASRSARGRETESAMPNFVLYAAAPRDIFDAGLIA